MDVLFENLFTIDKRTSFLDEEEVDGSKLAIQSSSPMTCLYKTELCRSYSENGHCKYGSRCQFAHGLEELRVVDRHPKYKTEICRSFHTTGSCQYGVRCRFIHISPNNEYEKTFFQESPSIFKDPLTSVTDLIENNDTQNTPRLPCFMELSTKQK